MASEMNVGYSESIVDNRTEREKIGRKTMDDAIDDDGISSASSSDFTPESITADQQGQSPLSTSSSSEWEDILGSGELLRKVLKPSSDSKTDTKPLKDDLVTIRIEGQLEGVSSKVDVCDKLTFLLGHSDVIAAFDLCVPFMNVGEVDEIRTSARFAYGKVGKDAEIPPYATISYTIELLSVEQGPDFQSMAADDLLVWVNKKRERGNYYFKREEYASALDIYNRALNLLQLEPTTKSEDERRRITDAKCTIYNNLAAAQLKIEAWNAAITSLRNCTALQPNNVKAHFRLGKAYAGQNDHQAAVEAYKQALALDKDNKAIQMELEHEKRLMKSENDRSKAVYKRMFVGADGPQSTETKSKWRSIAEWWKNRGVFANATTLLAITATAGAAVMIRYFNVLKA